MSTSDHLETDGQTERANRVLGEILRGYVHSLSSWSEFLPMVEFGINNLMHDSAHHTPFFVNGLRHPRLTTLLECDSLIRGGGTRSSKNRSVSCSSRVDANVVTCDADVDQVDINEEHHLSNSDNAIIDSDDDAGIFSIANNYLSEDDTILADEQKEESTLSAVRTRRTELNNAESAEGFLLAREAVVRFVHDSITYAVDRQKRNADKNGRVNVHSFV